MKPPVDVGVDRLADAGRRVRALVEQAVPSVAPTLALSVWRAGEPVLELAAGWMDPEAAHEPARLDAVFDLASITKVFSATAFLREVSAANVRLDDRVATVLPAFAADRPRAVDGGEEPLSRKRLPVPRDRAGWRVDPGEVTFEQLLTHTSGMAPWRSLFREAGPIPPPASADGPDEASGRWATAEPILFGYPFVDEPGAAVHYSDLGFMTLGAAVARLSGKRIDEAVEQAISGPLDLDSIGHRPLRRGIEREIIAPTSFDDDWRHRRLHGEVEDENAAGLGGVAGHAGIFGSAHDVAAFGQAWVSADDRLEIDPAIASRAVRDQTPGLEAARGLGWQVRSHAPDLLAPLGSRAYGHTGFTGTSLVIDPDRQVVVALLTNRVFAGRRHAAIERYRVDLHTAIAAAIDGS